MFRFLLSSAQDRYPDINFSSADYEKCILIFSGKNDRTEVVDIECENELSKFTCFLHKVLKKISKNQMLFN